MNRRVLVTGSRDWPASEEWTIKGQLEHELAHAYDHGDELLIVVHGACPTGADEYADQWAKRHMAMGHMVEVEPHPADWKRHGKGAGPIRNREMVSLGADICLAFSYNNSRGTNNCCQLALDAGIAVKVFAQALDPLEIL